MLQKTPHNAGDMDVFRIAGNARQNAADAADDELYFHTGAGSLHQLSMTSRSVTEFALIQM